MGILIDGRRVDDAIYRQNPETDGDDLWFTQVGADLGAAAGQTWETRGGDGGGDRGLRAGERPMTRDRERVDEASRVTRLTCEGARLSTDENVINETSLSPLSAVEHVLNGGSVAVQPGSLGLCVVTVDPHKGSIARDELHDGVPDSPLCVTRGADGECQVWYHGDKERYPERRWKHGRVIGHHGWVNPNGLTTIEEAVLKAKKKRRIRPADLTRLPAALH